VAVDGDRRLMGPKPGDDGRAGLGFDEARTDGAGAMVAGLP